MLWFNRLKLRIRALRNKQALDDILRQELEFHLEQQRAEFIAQGMSPSDAERAARRALGSVQLLEEECRDHRHTRWFEDVMQDARYAVRTFVKTPSFTAVAVATLALGIGANTAFFSTAWGILFRPLPYPDPERIVVNEEGMAGIGPITSQRDLSKTVDYAGYLGSAELSMQLSGEAMRVDSSRATFNLSRVLGVAPARGRWFDLANEQEGRHRVVILSHSMWRDRFNSDPAILGRRILLDEESYEVLGVMPQGFAFPSPDTDLWVPIRNDPRDIGSIWGRLSILAIGRLNSGVTVSQAQAELRPVLDRVRRMFPWRMPDEYARYARVVAYSKSLSKDVEPKVFALSAAALLLLLIACGNVANLLLARALRREREFAMREALGARRGRLLRQLFTENLVLVVAGGIGGLLAADIILRILPVLLPKDTPRLHEIKVDPDFLLAAAASMVVTVLLFSAAPLLRLWSVRRDPLAGRAVTASKRTSAFSLALIGGELALATMLLIGAGLMGRTLWRLDHVDSGFRSTGLITAHIAAGPSRCPGRPQCEALVASLNQTLIALPGARSVNWSNIAPLEKDFSAFAADIEDHPKAPGTPAWVLWENPASPGYFRALGIQLREGRLFDEGDRAGAPQVLLISESTAKRFWPHESAVGKRIRPVYDKEWRSIVGVVSDVAQYSLAGFPSWIDGVQYRPFPQTLPRRAAPLMRTVFIESTQPNEAVAALPSVLRRSFPDVVASRIATIERVRSESLANEQSTAWLLALLAALGLTLGIAGVYGVISHRTAQRTREIGIRMALGASGRGVVGIVVRETAIVAIGGCAAGVLAAFACSRYLQSLLFGITTHDPLTFTGCPLILLAAALLASSLPAWRASRTDPALTLRDE